MAKSAFLNDNLFQFDKRNKKNRFRNESEHLDFSVFLNGLQSINRGVYFEVEMQQFIGDTSDEVRQFSET